MLDVWSYILWIFIFLSDIPEDQMFTRWLTSLEWPFMTVRGNHLRHLTLGEGLPIPSVVTFQENLDPDQILELIIHIHTRVEKIREQTQSLDLRSWKRSFRDLEDVEDVDLWLVHTISILSLLKSTLVKRTSSSPVWHLTHNQPQKLVMSYELKSQDSRS